MTMQLPEEVLLLILSELQSVDLINCQKVCRAWYSPARKTLLREVQLNSATAINQFIKSIDLNSKSVYLKSVKKLSIGEEFSHDHEIYYLFDQEAIEKLFLRFPNLKEVHIAATKKSFKAFNDKICALFWKKCPNLEEFELLTFEWKTIEPYFDVLLRLRHLLTTINLKRFDPHSKYNSTEEFLSNFPRLKKIRSHYEQLSYPRLLPVIEKLPNLTSIDSEIDAVSEADFAERYQANMSTSEKARFEQKLAKITEIKVLFMGDFCTNSVKFLSKYMTNLNTFTMGGHNPDWNFEFQQVFTDQVVKLATSAKDNGWVHTSTNFDTFSRAFPHIKREVYQEIPSAYRTTAIKALNFIVQDYSDPSDRVDFQIHTKRSPFTRSLDIGIRNNTIAAIDQFLNLGPISEVNVLNVRIKQVMPFFETRYDFEPLVKKYDELFAKIPSIKKLDIELPTTYVEAETVHYTYDQTYYGLAHSQVNELILRAAPDLDIQSMLNRYSFTFPKLNRLSLYFFSGVWKPDCREFRAIIQGYSLKTLEIDMTPVKNKTLKYLTTQQPFCVIELETLSNNVRQLFKVSLDLSTVTRIIDSDLNGFVRGTDYFKVIISVNSLEHLELLMNNEHPSKDEYREYLDELYVDSITRAYVPLVHSYQMFLW